MACYFLNKTIQGTTVVWFPAGSRTEVAVRSAVGSFSRSWHLAGRHQARDGTLVGYIFSKRYKKVSPHRKSHNLLYNLPREKNKPFPEMVNKRGGTHWTDLAYKDSWVNRSICLWFGGFRSYAKTPLNLGTKRTKNNTDDYALSKQNSRFSTRITRHLLILPWLSFQAIHL